MDSNGFNFDEAEWELIEETTELYGSVFIFRYLRAKPEWGHNTFAMAVEFANRCFVRVAVRDRMVRDAHEYCYSAPVMTLPV